MKLYEIEGPVKDYYMDDQEITQHSSDRLGKALSGFFGVGKSISKLSQVLVYAMVKGSIS